MSSRCEARAGGGGASGAPFVGRGPRGTPGGKMTNVGTLGRVYRNEGYARPMLLATYDCGPVKRFEDR